MNTVISIPINRTDRQADEYVNISKNTSAEDILEFKGSITISKKRNRTKAVQKPHIPLYREGFIFNTKKNY